MKRNAIEGISSGDQQVFLDYYNRVSVQFLRFIYFRSGGDNDLAEDVFQEAFRRMIQSRDALVKLPDDGMLFPWLCGVARRILADHFRQKSRKAVISLDALDETVQAALLQFETENLGEDAAGHPQMQLLVGMVMSLLEPVYADALNAKYCEGLSVKQIAENFGETVKTIDGRLYRAREAFRVAFRHVRRELETSGAC